MKPLVTLVVTTLNRPTFLRETLGCVTAQNYENLEIIVSDNGSRDETPALGQELIRGDRRARFRSNPATVPVHEHFNQCLAEARGEFITYLSDDDRISPSFITEMVAVAERHAHVNVVVSAQDLIDEHGTLIEHRFRPDQEIFAGTDFVCNWIYRRTPVPFASIVTNMARTSAVRHFGGYQGFARGQNIDNVLLLQLAITGKVGFARNALFTWRVYDRSFGTTATVQQIAQSSREFRTFLRNDPRTVEALSALSPARHREIINGVRIMTSQEFLFRAGFYLAPYRWSVLRKLPVYGFDRLFWYVVLREYYHRLRRRLRSPRVPVTPA
jgi:glycosyltransferase involved in cell wall biosynthesis